MNIKTVGGRKTLKHRTAPYWDSLGQGRALGYRVGAAGGYWIAKMDVNRKRRSESLGDLSHVAESDQYRVAVQLANEWFMAHGQKASGSTVGSVCRIYTQRRKNAVDTSRYQVLIERDLIEKISLAKLTEANVVAWDLRHRSGKRTPFSKGAIEKKVATINRQRTFLRASLNAALETGLVSSDKAWKRALKPLQTPVGETVRRDLCLTREECSALLRHCRPDFVDFCTVLCSFPLRPGALAHCQVRDFSARLGNLHIRKDKEHAGRVIPVPTGLRELLEQRQKGRQGDELLFTMAGGRPWTAQTWGDPIKDAAAAAGLPAETVAYTLRHSVMTELCITGMDLMTLAKIAGTSLDMIEKHYGHLRADPAVAALDKISFQSVPVGLAQ